MSLLKAIELENFMSIKKARLEFDENNIISLCGYNDSGKSAITRALEVIFYNAYSTEHIKFIHDDEEYWGIGLEFDDGVEINRYKYIDGKTVWEMLKDGKMVYTNRLPNGGVSSIGGDIPKEVQDYLGVIEDEHTGEKLNVRRNTDKLFLITTTGGDNYKIINTVLRSDILAEASKRATEDKNKLQTELLAKKNSRETLKKEYDSMLVFDEDTVKALVDGSSNLEVSKQRHDYLVGVIREKRILDDFKVHDELSLVDTARFSELKLIQEYRTQMHEEVIPELPIIDSARYSSVNEIIRLRQEINQDITPEVGVVDTARLEEIKNIGKLFNDLWQISNELITIDTELNQTQMELNALAEQYNYKICGNCGAVV